MAIIKCKMCGGDLNLIAGQSVAECEYCGSRQTVPSGDDEKKLIQFERAERLRRNCEFDKAAGLYEAIVSDFRQEAEAYWGLVLCKYGIEYVDDPATGKKIPTCHRSSFDSIMDDVDLEQALENADAAARRVYREEAKAIEEIRKGIIAVSSNEQPYDIFICYKETDEKGDRTLDSVLAQDIYDALTNKGYRVFFSRITLEDKLGVEYEPYIFAALNSAKIMLAVGTDYEYYNAVWVKNEWSRYLKLMAQDKSKHLIPCFKGIDAYDLPREFAKLQAQDLGKMGAIQDILRGVEKLLPRQKSNPVVVQEKVVVGGTGGNNKVNALLERGNMALEDGDWAKADSFFEDVLNNDAKNAQAYIGKTLALERCRTMDALVRKRKDVYQNVRSETLYIKENTDHINQITEQYNLSGYVSADSIRKLYNFDLSYTSEVSGRQRQYREEEIWWQNHKQLSRAEKFAVGAVAEHLQNEKKHLFAQLAERVNKAQEADSRAVAKLEAQYDSFLAETDMRAEQLYNEGIGRREQDYSNYLAQAKQETNPEKLKELEVAFAALGDYKDSKNLAEHCRKRAADEQAKIDAAIARDAAERARKKKKMTVIGAITACVVIAFLIILNAVIIPNSKYNNAVALMEAEQYEEAIAAFEALDGYKDCIDCIAECNAGIEKHRLAKLDEEYHAAIALMDAGKYEEAIAAFEALDGHKDSNSKIEECEIAIRDGHYEKLKQAYIGDYVIFGAYEQDNDLSNGKEEIEWLVLDKQDNKLLVISKFGLDCQQYNLSLGGVTWERCDLRKWLNDNFINAAFTADEKAVIPTVTVEAHENPEYDTGAGNATQDKVFLLSIPEADEYFRYRARRCAPTAYADYRGTWTWSSRCGWWLRSPGRYGIHAAIVDSDGNFDFADTVSDCYAVRPALWIDLSA